MPDIEAVSSSKVRYTLEALASHTWCLGCGAETTEKISIEGSNTGVVDILLALLLFMTRKYTLWVPFCKGCKKRHRFNTALPWVTGGVLLFVVAICSSHAYDHPYVGVGLVLCGLVGFVLSVCYGLVNAILPSISKVKGDAVTLRIRCPDYMHRISYRIED